MQSRAVQETRKEIDALEAEVAALRGQRRNTELRASPGELSFHAARRKCEHDHTYTLFYG
jgi:hypothetical protein